MGDEVAVTNVKGNIGHTDLDDIANPSLNHLGVFVSDIEEIQRYLKKYWGITEFQTLDYHPGYTDADRMKIGAPFSLHMANCYLFGQLLHISECLDEDGVLRMNYPHWWWHLKQNRDVIQHICISVDNWEKVTETLKGRGLRCYASHSYEGRRWAHFGDGAGGFAVEIEERV